MQIQNAQEIKRTLFNKTKQDKTSICSRKASFSSYVQQYNIIFFQDLFSERWQSTLFQIFLFEMQEKIQSVGVHMAVHSIELGL